MPSGDSKSLWERSHFFSLACTFCLLSGISQVLYNHEATPGLPQGLLQAPGMDTGIARSLSAQLQSGATQPGVASRLVRCLTRALILNPFPSWHSFVSKIYFAVPHKAGTMPGSVATRCVGSGRCRHAGSKSLLTWSTAKHLREVLV